MSSHKSVWASNAAANVLSGAVGAVVTLILPAILARSLSKSDFSIWNLAFPVAAYAQTLAVGVMTTTARSTATALYGDTPADLNKVMSGGLAVWLVALLSGLFLTCLYSFGYPSLVQQIDARSVDLFAACALAFGISMSLQSVALLPAGIFIGHQKNIYWALSQIIAKSLLLTSIVYAGYGSASLLEVVAFYFASSLLLIPISYGFLAKYYPAIFRSLGSVKRDWSDSGKMLRLYGLFSVLNINVFIVSALSTAIVGYFAYEMVTPFAMAMTVVNVIVGILQAVMAPISPQFIRIKFQEGSLSALALAIRTLTYVVSFFAVTLVLYRLLGKDILVLWIGADYGERAYPLLAWLLVATAVRNSCLPLSMLMLSIGASKSNLTPALSESLAYILLSFILGFSFGVKGILIAAILSSFVSIGGYVFVLRSEFQVLDVKKLIGQLRYHIVSSLLLGAASLASVFQVLSLLS